MRRYLLLPGRRVSGSPVLPRMLVWSLLMTFGQATISQEATHIPRQGWHLLDPATDGYLGISLDKAYTLLKGRSSKTVIVAVIDSGVDTAQEDLQTVLWNNPGEIPHNGKDDDGNGYIDDIHGWNFDGSPTGENLAHNSLEITRVYHHWKKDFEGKKSKEIPKDQRYLFDQWTKAAGLIDKDYDDARKELPNMEQTLQILEQSSSAIYNELHVTEFTGEQVRPLVNHSNDLVKRSAALWTDLFTRNNNPALTSTAVLTEVRNYKGQLDTKIARKMLPPEDWRGELTKDRYEDITDRSYGNNNLTAGSGDHGTLVSGTIAATRNNGIGIDGIADNVRIMAVRAVPGGDEHDKDVALAIRYAVDNGARVINMSFGKPVSPYKYMVDDAVKYAAAKGVLLVHGSGNDGRDITDDIFYPNPVFLDGTHAVNYLTVGASGDTSTGYYAAPFSNFSHGAVDVFAPGMFIYTTAAANRYLGADGTSLSCPVATGVAALLFSYFPSLTPQQVIRILVNSGTPVPGKVLQPGSDEKKVAFSTLSVSGKVINAADAVKMAMELTK